MPPQRCWCACCPQQNVAEKIRRVGHCDAPFMPPQAFVRLCSLTRESQPVRAEDASINYPSTACLSTACFDRTDDEQLCQMINDARELQDFCTLLQGPGLGFEIIVPNRAHQAGSRAVLRPSKIRLDSKPHIRKKVSSGSFTISNKK